MPEKQAEAEVVAISEAFSRDRIFNADNQAMLDLETLSLTPAKTLRLPPIRRLTSLSALVAKPRALTLLPMC